MKKKTKNAKKVTTRGPAIIYLQRYTPHEAAILRRAVKKAEAKRPNNEHRITLHQFIRDSAFRRAFVVLGEKLPRWLTTKRLRSKTDRALRNQKKLAEKRRATAKKQAARKRPTKKPPKAKVATVTKAKMRTAVRATPAKKSAKAARKTPKSAPKRARKPAKGQTPAQAPQSPPSTETSAT